MTRGSLAHGSSNSRSLGCHASRTGVMAVNSVMTLVDASTGVMRCERCGSCHVGLVRPSSEGGGLHPDARRCPRGCRLGDSSIGRGYRNGQKGGSQ